MHFIAIILAFFLCLYCALASSSTGSSSSSPEMKLKQISELARNSKGHIITLDDATFQYYAHAKPRPYSLIVFMTAAHPKYKCSVCKTIDNELTMVAQAYQRKAADENTKVFFVRLEYEASPKVFQGYGVSSVPVVFHIPPLLSLSQLSQSGSGDNSKDYSISTREKYQVPPIVDAESLASFVRDRTGVSLTIARSMLGTYLLLLAIFAVLAALIKPVINALPTILSIIRKKSIWALVSAGVYTCAISGLIFDIIRSPQMYYMNGQTGQIMFFYPQAGNQFVVEGFVIGFLNMACAVALIVCAVVIPKVKDEQMRTIGMIAGIAIFILCFRSIRGFYIMKNNWYGRAF